MKPPKDSLLLIDGHALLYRAYHALPPLQTKDGVPTNAVYGFITTIFKALDEIKPKYIAVAFDVKGPTFRHKAFDGYKASRKETPEDLAAQVPYAYKVAEAFNMPIFTKEGFEADDVIGTLAEQAKKEKVPVVIVTGDRDAFQLVDDGTCVYTMSRSIADTKLYDAEAVKAKMGITPAQVPDYKALAGDSSDEIPGIAGIGEKTAITILSHHNSIEDLYAKLKANAETPEVTDRIRQKLIDGEEIAQQSKMLGTIDRNVPIELKINDCVVHDYDPKKVTETFQRLEFFSLLKRLPASFDQLVEAAPTPTVRDWTFDILTTESSITTAVESLMKQDAIVFDTETDDLYGPIIGISLAATGTFGYYIPTIPEHGSQVSLKKLGEILQPLLENPKIGKIGHNIKYDMAIMRQLNIAMAPIAFDTMVAAYVLHANLRTFDFDSVAQRELNYTPISFSEVVGKTIKPGVILAADPQKLAEYAAEDAIITYRLYEHFTQAFQKEPTLYRVATELDFPLIPILEEMESRGICINISVLEKIKHTLEKEITLLAERITSHAKEPININSPAQLQKLLFDELGLDKQGIKTTQNGLSTAASELEKLQGLHPIIEDLLKYREYTKLQSTYVETLPKLADADGRLHTRFSQTTAATGRLASNDPNLQNIPIRTEIGSQIRTAFVAAQGWEFISLDYSQFELRLIAHLSEDEQLKQVFLDGRDIHDEVSKKLGIDRRAAKAINFGIIYGLSAFGLSQGLKIDPKIAKQYIDAYFAEYKGVAEYLQKTKQEVKEKGYVETLFGRRRELPEIHSGNAIVRAQAERMAINAPAQGTEADLMKIAMIQTDSWIKKEYDRHETRPYQLLQIHDSILIECPQTETEKVAREVKRIMESVATLSVPLIVDVSVGPNWGEMTKLKL